MCLITQLCPTLCDPTDCRPPGSSVHGDSPGNNTGVLPCPHRPYAAAATAAKSLQSCPTLCDPIDSSPPGSTVLDSPGKHTGVGCHFLLQCIKVKMKSLSRVRFFATPWTAAYQAPLSMGFSRQEYWSGVPLPSPKRTWIYLIH